MQRVVAKTRRVPNTTEETPDLLLARSKLAENMVRLRGRRGWSQDALALESGVHRTMIAKLEMRRRNPSFDTLVRLASALGVTLHELFAP